MAESRYATKKSGKTEVDPFWNWEDIKGMMDHFYNKKQYHHYLTFMLGLLLGRRIGDTLSLQWSDLYYENGKIKDQMTTVREQKTGKTVAIDLCQFVKELIKEYVELNDYKPTEDLDGFVFPSKGKDRWREHEVSSFYDGFTGKDAEESEVKGKIEKWISFLDKDFSDKRKDKIYSDFIKNKHFDTLEGFLCDLEYETVLKSQVAAYQFAFKEASEAVGIQYNVNSHSTRKTFGYWSRKIHPHDVNSMETLRDIFGHSDVATTAHYIGLSAENKRTYFNDAGELFKNMKEGKAPVLKNSPVITLKSEDLIDILQKAIDGNSLDVKLMGDLMKLVDEKRVS